ncbi:FAD-dependent oxidoreductase [Actinosynnema sp. NPDC050436]|uniref:FAD-dependent oxidoreductase n=1 Tax=Actinosynnema sp. NPDC050436 TaxID=3155659 RepID=UPI0033C2F242
MDTTTAQESLWLLDARRQHPLAADTAVDVAVVGAGVVGVTTALLLKQAGLRVALVEADRVGSGASGNNTAKVTALQATVYSEIRKAHDADAAADYAAASLAGVARVAALAGGVDCDLRRMPAYTYAQTRDEVAAVDQEADAASDAGLPVARDRGELLGVPFEVYHAVRLDDQLALHPVKYLRALAQQVDGDGSHVFEGSRVTGIESGDPCQVHTGSGTVVADRVVVATHFPLLDRAAYFARLETTRAYCVAARLRSGAPPTGLGISAGSPSWSLATHGDLLIVSGQSHSTGSPEGEPYRVLADFAREHWDVAAFTHRWSAQDVVAFDKLPMVGTYAPGSDRLHVATGFRKWGLSGGTFAALALTGALTGSPQPWADRFSPHRLSLRSAPTLLRKNAEVVVDLVGDRLKPGEAASPDDVPRGSGRLVRQGLGKVGVFRDDDGALHAVSARCTHLGCLVRFNDAERSWDCPCHGSRFGVDGEVLEGPASTPLPTRDLGGSGSADSPAPSGG